MGAENFKQPEGVMKKMVKILLRKTRSFFIRLRVFMKRNPDRFLRNVSGVVHVGANTGQERALYERHGLAVIWVEPNPVVFEKLKSNIAEFPRQRAFRYLVSDQDDVQCTFHVANNDGASSSILELKLHKEVWPDVTYEKSISMQSITLASLVEKERINLNQFDALVLDVQGAELLVLQGAEALLDSFSFIKVEVPDFEAYAGCCQLVDIDAFLIPVGYRRVSHRKFGHHADGGCYYDVVYKRVPAKRRVV